ncbi:serine/threonine-protein kinase RIO1 [Nematolebias whitei]|uniref:serine/threonine-protein kinase RIO1 n=1 Tax=Nematolebias whitei TaxID=451745 RepID=UPI00189996F2|nr:serine/threonine-protein kinase RIO1 [Nematolebias whitei]
MVVNFRRDKGHLHPLHIRGGAVEVVSCYSWVGSYVNQVVRDALRDDRKVMTKSSAVDLVTQTDEKVEQLIIQSVMEKFPKHRLQTAGIPAPEPLLLRSHVLLMGFIGKDNLPAPLLKNATLSESKARELYLQVVQNMRKMFQDARLVHADLSEFNMLYHNGDVYIIDVSQSVEHDHPHALEFLRKDCSNVNEFFGKRGVAIMTVRELFDFITDTSITSQNMEQYLEKVMVIAAERTCQQRSDQDRVDEEVFKKAYIPRTLTEVDHYERDVELMSAKEGNSADSGHLDHILYRTLTGLTKDLSGVQTVPELLENQQQSSSEEEEEEEEEEEKEQLETSMDRKERKRMVKEAQREKRKTKVPKHVKKRKEKVVKMKKGQ